MTTDSLLPWQEAEFRRLLQLQAAGRLGHAWLLSGLAGSGTLQFARHLARTLLCSAEEGERPCGSCSSCHLFQQGTHPDWFLLQPPKRLIVVDQVREAIDFANTTSQRGGYKIVCIEPAESMNLNAANALLKLLEEPPAGTLLLLLTQQPGLLLATLRSRCQRLALPLPTREQAQAWLQTQPQGAAAAGLLDLAGGAPLRALELAAEGRQEQHAAVLDVLQELLSGSLAPIQAARQCDKFDAVAIMESLLRCLQALSLQLQGRQPLADPQLRLLAEVLAARAGERTALVLHSLHAQHARARRSLLSSNNPNALLVLEQVFGEWSKLRQRSGPRPARQALA
jgi:DNA polymerase-3 subunit delta'